MRKRTAGLMLTGALLAGTAGAVAVVPASASTSGNAVTSRLASIKSALSGLVSDGTLTQAQADKVASTLDQALPQRGPGGPGGRFGAMGATLEAAAKALGMSTDDLLTARRSGKSLAAIAKEKSVSTDTLIKDMVAAAEDQLTSAVKSGQLTQAQADKIKSNLTQRITDEVNNVHPGPGPGQRQGAGFGRHGSAGTGQGARSGAAAPSGAV